jgi:mevalonate kinase
VKLILIMPITETENKFLNSLIVDSIIYRLSTEESLSYIQTRFKKISEASYKKRKAAVLSDESTQVWLNYFTRIGFVQHHKEQMEHIQRVEEDSMRQFFVETIKGNRNEDRILKLKQDIRDNVKLLSELGLGTPIISAIKAKLERQEDAKTIQVR